MEELQQYGIVLSKTGVFFHKRSGRRRQVVSVAWCRREAAWIYNRLYPFMNIMNSTWLQLTWVGWRGKTIIDWEIACKCNTAVTGLTTIINSRRNAFHASPFLKTPHLSRSTCHIWQVDIAREALMDVEYDRCTRHWQMLVIWYFSFLAGEEGEAHPGWYFLSFPMRQFIIIMNGVSIGLEFAWAWWMVGSVRVSTSKQLAFNAE